jgi:hypothetical protein
VHYTKDKYNVKDGTQGYGIEEYARDFVEYIRHSREIAVDRGR